MTNEQIQDSFTYLKPSDEGVHFIEWLRNRLRQLALQSQEIPMDERCRAEFTTRLEEASMWGNKGIVLHDAHR